VAIGNRRRRRRRRQIDDDDRLTTTTPTALETELVDAAASFLRWKGLFRCTLFFSCVCFAMCDYGFIHVLALFRRPVRGRRVRRRAEIERERDDVDGVAPFAAAAAAAWYQRRRGKACLCVAPTFFCCLPRCGSFAGGRREEGTIGRKKRRW
jgi:hypothetical protein